MDRLMVWSKVWRSLRSTGRLLTFVGSGVAGTFGCGQACPGRSGKLPHLSRGAVMTKRRSHNQGGRTTTDAALYSSKIIKAGAILADTKTLLSHWDVNLPVGDNLDRIRRENVFAKASRSRVDDILAILRQRYLLEDQVTKALVVFVKQSLPTASLDRILFFHSARSDRLLQDVVTGILLPMHARGIMDVSVAELERIIGSWVREGKTVAHWSEIT